MMKMKQYDIADSNIANLGSELEKSCKLSAAQSEKAWATTGGEGLLIWRIEKFEVKPWPKEQYGEFFSDDSYIVLNGYKQKDSDKILFDLHFWLGATTSQDESGTAAYKTVELDDYLRGVPVQHREVQNHESKTFLSYFAANGGIRLLAGGIESGFNHVSDKKEYKPRLLHVKGKKNVRVVQQGLKCSNLNSGDIFILDAGEQIFQWNGKGSGAMEKSKAMRLTRSIADGRKGASVTVLDEGDADGEKFWALLEGTPADVGPDGCDDEEWEVAKEPKIWRLTEEDGKFSFSECEAKGKAALDSKDAFIVDVGCQVFTWIGKEASALEKKQALGFAQVYLKDQGRPDWTPITRVLEGMSHQEFDTLLG